MDQQRSSSLSKERNNLVFTKNTVSSCNKDLRKKVLCCIVVEEGRELE